MAIRGSLREASLPDVLQLLAMGKKTGCLSLTHRNNFGFIFFDRGRITYASIVNRRDRLGDMLVKTGVLAQDDLERAVSTQGRQQDRRLGEILVEGGAISRTQLEACVRVQIEEAVYFLFTWTQGNFNFEPDVLPEHQDLLLSINPEALLLEGARRVDEWELIEKKVPSFDVVFEVDHARVVNSDARLTGEQRLILELIDGLRDVQAIVDASGLVEFDVGKALYGLATAGFIRRVNVVPRAMPAAPLESRVEEHRNLGIAFFKTGMFEEALREFRRVLDLSPADLGARMHAGLVLARQERWSDAAAEFAIAAAHPGATWGAAHNLAAALERDGRLPEARVALDEALARGGDADPRVRLADGILRLLQGDLPGADATFTAVREMLGSTPPSALLFHYAALTAALRGETERAQDILTDGTMRHPASAALANNLGLVLERAGNSAAARQAFERGLREDATLPQLLKNLGDQHYHAGDFDTALDFYARAVKVRPDLGDDVYLRIGNIRLKQHDRQEAVRAWERAAELNPANAIVQANLQAVREVLR